MILIVYNVTTKSLYRDIHHISFAWNISCVGHAISRLSQMTNINYIEDLSQCIVFSFLIQVFPKTFGIVNKLLTMQ